MTAGDRYLAAAALLIVGLAIFGSERLWTRYNRDPWTRDGRVRADVVLVSPDINGLVATVAVRDGQKVRIGDTLFVIDQPRYQLALEQAEALDEQVDSRADSEEAPEDESAGV